MERVGAHILNGHLPGQDIMHTEFVSLKLPRKHQYQKPFLHGGQGENTRDFKSSDESE